MTEKGIDKYLLRQSQWICMDLPPVDALIFTSTITVRSRRDVDTHS